MLKRLGFMTPYRLDSKNSQVGSGAAHFLKPHSKLGGLGDPLFTGLKKAKGLPDVLYNKRVNSGSQRRSVKFPFESET